jgi:hypothetical protein
MLVDGSDAVFVDTHQESGPGPSDPPDHGDTAAVNLDRFQKTP